MKKFTYKNEQTGRSMIEMLGVLAIVGVLSVGGIAGYSKAMAKFKIGKTQDQIMNIVNNIRTLYGAEPNYAGLNVTTLISANIAPKDMIRGAELVNAFGGTVTIAPAGSVANMEGFGIAFHDLPKEVCIALATSDWGSAATGLDAIRIDAANAATVANGVAMATPGGVSASATGMTAIWTTTALQALPISIVNATTACDSVTKNTVAFFYR